MRSVLRGEALQPAALFLVARLMLLIALPLEGLRGYGDFVHFYRLAGMGQPFLDLWVEFPPAFPFFSRLMYLMAGGQEHIYDYLLAISLSLFQAGELVLFAALSHRLYSPPSARRRTWVYLVFLLGLAYGWWYFDPLASLLLLLGLYWLLEERDTAAGLALGLGALTKLFPLLVLPLAWRWRPPAAALRLSLAALGLVAAVYAALWTGAPEFTRASLSSQASKGSWETIWALIDGNLDTGNFGPESERYDPSSAYVARGNPAHVPSWLTLLGFGALGVGLVGRVRLVSARQAVAFLGLTWCLFLVWSPGWSPQWVLYLLPLVFLALPLRMAVLMNTVLVLVNLLEWPVLLSRGLSGSLNLTITARTALLVLLAFVFWRQLRSEEAN